MPMVRPKMLMVLYILSLTILRMAIFSKLFNIGGCIGYALDENKVKKVYDVQIFKNLTGLPSANNFHAPGKSVIF
jgi:hypothetical protein